MSAGVLSRLEETEDATWSFLLIAGGWCFGASVLRALWGKPVRDTLLVGAACVLAASTWTGGGWAGIGLGVMAAAVALAGFNRETGD